MCNSAILDPFIGKEVSYTLPRLPILEGEIFLIINYSHRKAAAVLPETTDSWSHEANQALYTWPWFCHTWTSPGGQGDSQVTIGYTVKKG
jgi:hypothetical protein